MALCKMSEDIIIIIEVTILGILFVLCNSKAVDNDHQWSQVPTCLSLDVLFTIVAYPTGKNERAGESEANEEKRFPNGTVVGRYSYMDKDGNPIQVKYFADDASYGVELKSLKVVDTTAAAATNLKDNNPPKITQQNSPKSDFSAGVLNSLDSISKAKTNMNRYKGNKNQPDFEIYYQNELKGPEKCGKEKVHVYFDKERKIRNVIDNFEADKYCEQF